WRRCTAVGQVGSGTRNTKYWNGRRRGDAISRGRSEERLHDRLARLETTVEHNHGAPATDGDVEVVDGLLQVDDDRFLHIASAKRSARRAKNRSPAKSTANDQPVTHRIVARPGSRTSYSRFR